MAGFSKQQIEGALDVKAEHLTREDVERIVQNRAAVEQLIGKFPVETSLQRLQAMLLFELLQAEATGEIEIPFEGLKQAAAALIYLGAPLDLVPDESTAGLSDDAAIVDLAVCRLQGYVTAFCELKGRDASDYFA